ncbi:gas vesicle protein K [Streptomyces orinoci]|uniref:Gas vesicle protein K n=1 Tax=Streptomyces orinoci TaxID=67339 RepID=A0ABV3JVX4_STRON|nr:gas vesicle protein K [Streptomyces orinoci]
MTRHVDIDPDRDREAVERDLMRLVLTLVDLLRELMERQALRRVEGGQLTEEQEERVGVALMLLDERMAELCARFGLHREELDLDLGPLGSLLGRAP